MHSALISTPEFSKFFKFYSLKVALGRMIMAKGNSHQSPSALSVSLYFSSFILIFVNFLVSKEYLFFFLSFKSII